MFQERNKVCRPAGIDSKKRAEQIAAALRQVSKGRVGSSDPAFWMRQELKSAAKRGREMQMQKTSEQMDAPSGSKILRGALISVLVLVAGVVLMRGFLRTQRKAPRVVPPEMSLRVQTQTVKKRTIPLFLEGLGTTQADKIVEIVPEVSGKIVFALPDLKPGLGVKKGKTLFRIDRDLYDLEYQRLKAQYEPLKIQLAIGEKSLALDILDEKRNRQLLKRGAIDPSTFERVQLKLLERQQRQETIRQSISLIEVQMKQAQLNISRSTLTAPFDGKVTQGNLTKGGYVQAGRGVLTIESTDAVELPVSFGIDDLHKVIGKDGKPVDIAKLPAFLKTMGGVEVRNPQEPGEVWKGEVTRTGGRLNLQTRTLDLWISVSLQEKGKELPTLLSGVFCSVKIPFRRSEGALLLPMQALHEGEAVYLAVKGRLKKRRVVIDHKTNDFFVVTGGLENGDQVIVSPILDPVENTAVSIVNNEGGKP